MYLLLPWCSASRQRLGGAPRFVGGQRTMFSQAAGGMTVIALTARRLPLLALQKKHLVVYLKGLAGEGPIDSAAAEAAAEFIAESVEAQVGRRRPLVPPLARC